MDWTLLARQVLNGHECTRDEAREILNEKDGNLLALINGAYVIRSHYYGNKVKLNMIINAKSGRCPENCAYCSQSIYADTDIDNYSLVDQETIVEGARRAKEGRIGTYCIVMSGRKASNREIRAVSAAVKQIKQEMSIKICACLGLIDKKQAEALKEAGVDRYNHNLNTSERYYDQVATTHHYSDRVRTIEAVKEVGISPCAGGICGMGETEDDLLDMAFACRSLDSDSIPVNFLNPIPGTRFADKDELTPNKCLKILSMFRFVNPKKEIRIAGGREYNLRSMQCLGLYVANSIFVDGYLTTGGQGENKDIQMINDLGFEVEENAFETQSQDL
ncbi:biotin synthase BioB [Sporolactobacillus sp. THM7-4]|nr:biotin synthase BioB [Sporolactobacillus sp. THM7-4]